MNKNLNCYEKIFNNFLEASYLNVLVKIKNPQESLMIIYRAFERVMMIDYHVDDLLNIKERLFRYILNQEKNYLLNNKSVIDSIEIENVDSTIPEKLYLLNFNAYKIFNDVDNQILIGILIFKKDIKDLMILLNNNEKYILERYKSVLQYIHMVFNNNIKELFTNI